MPSVDAMLIPEILKYFLVAVGFSIGFVYARLAKIYWKQPCGLSKLGISIAGFYWAFYYVRSILDISIPLHQIWVRSPLLWTLAFVLAMGILSLRRLER